MYQIKVNDVKTISEIKRGGEQLFQSACDFIFKKNRCYGFHISDMLGFIVDESPKHKSIGHSLEISLTEEELIDFKFNSLIIKNRFDELKEHGVSDEYKKKHR